jgi:nucleoid DNA-binding protein
LTKTELQSALAEATPIDKRTAEVFRDTLGAIAYKEIKKNGEFVLPGFGKLVKQKRKAQSGFNPKDARENQDSSQDRGQISGCQGRKGRGLWGKEVVKELREVAASGSRFSNVKILITLPD